MYSRYQPDDGALPTVLLDDGRPLLSLGAVGLILAGLFAFFLSAAGEFLPHDLAWLGMGAAELRSVAGGRVADFMVHDRVAFGGTLVAVGILYLWLIAVPLPNGERWAWRLLALSCALGFASFFAWVGFGYLDTWHAIATIALLPAFAGGLVLTRGLVAAGAGRLASEPRPAWTSPAGAGRALLLLTGLGMVVAGAAILTIGTLVVFVPQDLAFLGLDRAQLDLLNPRLVPLIAHDRSGFGGGLMTAGLVVLGCAWFGRPSRSLWQALLVAGSAGFGAAIGIHGLVGYLDASHVGPAAAGALVFAAGMLLARPRSADPALVESAPGPSAAPDRGRNGAPD